MICIFAASVLTVYEKNLVQKQFRNTRVGGWVGGSLYDVTFCLAAWSPVPSRGLCPWSHVPSRGGGSLTIRAVKSGRYTSYWNAFLLLNFQQQKINQEKFSPWRRFGHSPRSANVMLLFVCTRSLSACKQ